MWEQPCAARAPVVACSQANAKCKSWTFHSTPQSVCWTHYSASTGIVQEAGSVSGVPSGALPPLPPPAPPPAPMGVPSGPDACTPGTNGTKFKFCDGRRPFDTHHHHHTTTHPLTLSCCPLRLFERRAFTPVLFDLPPLPKKKTCCTESSEQSKSYPGYESIVTFGHLCTHPPRKRWLQAPSRWTHAWTTSCRAWSSKRSGMNSPHARAPRLKGSGSLRTTGALMPSTGCRTWSAFEAAPVPRHSLHHAPSQRPSIRPSCTTWATSSGRNSAHTTTPRCTTRLTRGPRRSTSTVIHAGGATWSRREKTLW